MHWIKKLLNSLGLMHPCGCGMDRMLQRRGVPRGSGLLVPYDNYTHMGVYYKLKLPYMGTH